MKGQEVRKEDIQNLERERKILLFSGVALSAAAGLSMLVFNGRTALMLSILALILLAYLAVYRRAKSRFQTKVDRMLAEYHLNKYLENPVMDRSRVFAPKDLMASRFFPGIEGKDYLCHEYASGLVMGEAIELADLTIPTGGEGKKKKFYSGLMVKAPLPNRPEMPMTLRLAAGATCEEDENVTPSGLATLFQVPQEQQEAFRRLGRPVHRALACLARAARGQVLITLTDEAAYLHLGRHFIGNYFQLREPINQAYFDQFGLSVLGNIKSVITALYQTLPAQHLTGEVQS